MSTRLRQSMLVGLSVLLGTSSCQIKNWLSRAHWPKEIREEALEKAVDEVAKTYPAIILTEAQHTPISNALNAAWKKVGKENMSKKELRKIYKDVYAEYPHWLEAIESYLR